MAPLKHYELDILIDKASSGPKATRKVAAALHLIAMGRVGWDYTPADKFAKWIKCKPKNVAKYLAAAPVVAGAGGMIVGSRVLANRIPKASQPYVGVRLPVPVGNKAKLIRHLKRAKANVREGWSPYAHY
jgi:hypothetical protein